MNEHPLTRPDAGPLLRAIRSHVAICEQEGDVDAAMMGLLRLDVFVDGHRSTCRPDEHMKRAGMDMVQADARSRRDAMAVGCLAAKRPLAQTRRVSTAWTLDKLRDDPKFSRLFQHHVGAFEWGSHVGDHL
jgi:hypothetical protein